MGGVRRGRKGWWIHFEVRETKRKDRGWIEGVGWLDKSAAREDDLVVLHLLSLGVGIFRSQYL